MEVEIKVKVNDFEDIKEELISRGVEFEEPKLQTDIYYKRDEKEPVPLRIRIEENKQGKTIFLTAKIPTDVGGTWEEYETEISNEKQLVEILKKIGYKEDIKKVKKRQQGTYGKMEVNFDEVEELGKFIEFEVISDNIQEAQELIKKTIKELGLSEEGIIQRGYTSMLKEKKGIK